MEFTRVDIPDEEIARRRALYEPLTESVRELIDAVIRTEVDDDTVRAVHATIDDAVRTLRKEQLPGSFGVLHTETTGLPWGNAAMGMRNAIAPPLRPRRHDDGHCSFDVELGAAYEGPPDLVHGGICALLLDELLGWAASAEKPAFTGTLTIRYNRPTPLGIVHGEARVTEQSGRKTIVTGGLYDANGGQTVVAEGIFIRARGI